MKRYLGIDIGGTKIAGAVVRADGTVLHREEVPTPAQEGGRRVLAAALDLAQKLVSEGAAHGPVAGVGIGAGGQIDPARGVVLSATSLLPGWAGTDLQGAFERALGVPARADNDVNALAVGEARFGAARGLATVVFVALGTGLGGALLVNGVPLRGAHGGGGEFGHLLVSINGDGRTDAGGGGSTWEAYASGPGLAATFADMAGPDAPRLTGRGVGDAARADPQGIAALAVIRTGEHLGFGLASLANIFDPDVMVVGGGLAGLGEALLGPARRVLARLALPHAAGCPVVRAALGADASVVGAASLAMP